MATPNYYLPIMPYLVVDHADRFIEFMKAVFGARERMKMPRPEGGIMHAEITIGAATIMVAQYYSGTWSFSP